MEALNLTKNEYPQVCLKRFCLHTNCWLLNLKIFRTTFFQSTSQQLKAAKNSTTLESKNESIKQKQQQQTQQQHKKSSRISLPTHRIFLMDFLRAVYLFRRLKTCFAHIHLGYWDYVICYMPFVFKSYCLFWVTCSNFFFYRFCTFDFSDEVVNMDELFFSGSINI